MLTALTQYNKHLPEAEQVGLVTRAQKGDQAAGNALVMTSMGLVMLWVHRFKGYDLPEEDRIAAALEGLARAIPKFKPEKGTFCTYATWWIRAYLLLLVKTEKMFGSGGRDNFFDTNDETVRLRRMPVFSLNDKVWGDEGDAEFQDFLRDETDSPELTMLRQEAVGEVADLMVGLDAKSKAILKQRVLNEEPETLTNVGHTYGVSRERIRQIEHKALKLMTNRALERKTGVTPSDKALSAALTRVKKIARGAPAPDHLRERASRVA